MYESSFLLLFFFPPSLSSSIVTSGPSLLARNNKINTRAGYKIVWKRIGKNFTTTNSRRGRKISGQAGGRREEGGVGGHGAGVT